jgi:hypothetical protein
MSQNHDRLSPTPLPQSAVRVVTAYQPFVLQNWYDDAFAHSVGDDVDVDARFFDDESMRITVFSKEGRKTSGIKLEIDLSRDENGDPSARVRAIWWSDRGPMSGELEDVRGEIYVNSISYTQTHTLYIKFRLATFWISTPKILMGGLRIEH